PTLARPSNYSDCRIPFLQIESESVFGVRLCDATDIRKLNQTYFGESCYARKRNNRTRSRRCRGREVAEHTSRRIRPRRNAPRPRGKARSGEHETIDRDRTVEGSPRRRKTRQAKFSHKLRRHEKESRT